MKIFDLKTDSNESTPSDLLTALIIHIRDNRAFETFLTNYDFDSEEEVKEGLFYVNRVVIQDNFLKSKAAKDNLLINSVKNLISSLLCHANSETKFVETTAPKLWNEFFLPAKREKTLQTLREQPRDASLFASSCELLKYVYSFSDTDIKKIAFFVQQVINPNFMVSWQRVLYFWGKRKMTGKTTTSRVMASVFNGCEKGDCSDFNSSLSTEMQFKNFSVPKISKYNVVLLDECFFADMSKTYSDFKAFITSENGTARLPYGLEFRWFGRPNYIMSSNDNVKDFIKDWDDRRFLSVEFTNTRRMDDADITNLWSNFINNCPILNKEELQNEKDLIFEIANESGEKTDYKKDYQTELLKSDFVRFVFDKPEPTSPLSNDNRFTLKNFLDFFSQHDNDARRHRKEVEEAVVSVFGEREKGYNFWSLLKIRQQLCESSLQPENRFNPDDAKTDVLEEDYFEF